MQAAEEDEEGAAAAARRRKLEAGRAKVGAGGARVRCGALRGAGGPPGAALAAAAPAPARQLRACPCGDSLLPQRARGWRLGWCWEGEPRGQELLALGGVVTRGKASPDVSCLTLL